MSLITHPAASGSALTKACATTQIEGKDMKVLFVTNMWPTPDFIYNGIHVKEQIDHLIQVYNFEHELYFINGRKSKINYFKSIFQLNTILQKKKFDLIHIHFGLTGLFLLFNPFMKTPTVVTLHGDDINSSKLLGFMKLITKLVVRRVNKVIILNDKMSTILKSHQSKLVKIPCGINVNGFRQSRENNSGNFLIGFPGDRRRPEKNFPLFNQIIEGLKEESYTVETIEFHNMTREEVAQSLRKLDCLILTSTREGSPQIIKEALASNIPIISTNVGDVQFLLDGVKNCYVIDSFSPPAFIDAVKKIQELPANQRSSNGLERIYQIGLDDQSISKRIYQMYKELT